MVLLGVISAVAFATILAVVAGLTITAATSFAHDIYASVLKSHQVTEDEQVRVSRITVVVLGIFAIGLGILANGQNIAFLVALAFAVAAAANLPTILYSLYWPRFNTRGALWSMYGGLISTIVLIVFSPAVSGAKTAMLPQRGLRLVPAGQPRHRVDSAGVHPRHRRHADVAGPRRPGDQCRVRGAGADRRRRREGRRRALSGRRDYGTRAGISPPESLSFTCSKPSRRHDCAFGLLAYAFAAIMVGTTLPTPMYALYGEQMHFAVLTTTVIYATYAGGVLFALLAFGRWSDAIGRRPVLLAGVVFALASAAVFLVADSVPMLLVGRVLSGLSAGIFTGTATAAVIEAAPENWRTRAAAVATVANIGGLGTGPLLAGSAGRVRARATAPEFHRAHRAGCCWPERRC